MLRMLVVVLLLANGLYFAWTQGYLKDWSRALGLGGGVTSVAPETSPSALYEPLHPEAIEWVEEAAVPSTAVVEPVVAPDALTPAVPVPAVVVQDASTAVPAAAPQETAATDQERAALAESPVALESSGPPEQLEAAAPVEPVDTVPVPVVAAPPPAPKQCMALGVFSAEQMEPIRVALQGIARSQWRIKESPVSGRWMVFWGGATDELVLSARRGELQSKGVPFERLRSSPVGVGFSLGRFSSEAAAQQHRKDIERKGVRAATVEVERPPSTLYTLEFPDYAAVKEVLQRDLGRYMGARTWQSC